jgi:hypothetical protein
MGATEVAAWIGAATGTTSILWDVFKYLRSGPKLRIQANPNMVPAKPRPGYPADSRWTLVRVANVGSSRTTLMALSLEIYHSRFAVWRRATTERLAVLQAWPTPLPYALDVGEEWSTLVVPDVRLTAALEKGLLFVNVEDAHKAKGTRIRVCK